MNRKTYIRSEYKADREAAKEYLSQLYRLDLRIKSKKMQIEALDDCLKSITVNTDALRVDGGKAMDMGDRVGRIIDLKNSINEDIFKYAELQEDISYKINKLPNLLAIVLELKHMHGLYNWQIAQELKYSPGNIDFIYAEALVKFYNLWLS